MRTSGPRGEWGWGIELSWVPFQLSPVGTGYSVFPANCPRHRMAGERCKVSSPGDTLWPCPGNLHVGGTGSQVLGLLVICPFTCQPSFLLDKQEPGPWGLSGVPVFLAKSGVPAVVSLPASAPLFFLVLGSNPGPLTLSWILSPF